MSDPCNMKGIDISVGRATKLFPVKCSSLRAGSVPNANNAIPLRLLYERFRQWSCWKSLCSKHTSMIELSVSSNACKDGKVRKASIRKTGRE